MKAKRIYQNIVSTQYARRWDDLPDQLQITLACGHNQWVQDPESLSRALSMSFRKKALCRVCMKSAQQGAHLTGGTVPPANIDQRPEVDSASEDNQRPATSR